MLPTAISGWPRRAAAILTVSSGSVVPKDSTVKLMMVLSTSKTVAISDMDCTTYRAPK